jgi:hypothetical protein
MMDRAYFCAQEWDDPHDKQKRKRGGGERLGAARAESKRKNSKE